MKIQEDLTATTVNGIKGISISSSDFQQNGVSNPGSSQYVAAADHAHPAVPNYYYSLSTGLISGGVISVDANGTSIDVTPATVQYVNNSNPSSPILDTLVLPQQTAVTPPSLNLYNRQWIGVQRVSPGVGGLIFSTKFTAAQRRVIAIIGRVWSNGTTTITGIGHYATPAWGTDKTLEDLIDTLGSQNRTGNVFSANPGTLTLNKSAGTSFRFTGYSGTNEDSPNICTDAAISGISSYDYQTLQNTTGLITTLSSLDPNNYDNAGVLTSVPAGYFTIQRIYQFPNSEVIDITYGQATYSTLSAALNGISIENVQMSVPNQYVLYGAMLRGWVVIQQGCTDCSISAKAQIVQNLGFNAGVIGGISTAPTITMVGDQLCINGVVTGPHLTGSSGGGNSASGFAFAAAMG